jgi:N-carbamoyl-L-amino-acid hydrolase
MKLKRADIAQSSGIITFKINYLSAHKSIEKMQTKSLNLTYKQMQSGAGHDSQDILIAPIGMIFVPSVAGISHSKRV